LHAAGDSAAFAQMKTERRESATTRWLADSTFVTLMPKKLKKPIEILHVTALSKKANRVSKKTSQ
jgi:hypothetical protein